MLPTSLLLFDFRCVAHFGILNSIRQFSFANYKSHVISFTPYSDLKRNDYPFAAILGSVVILCWLCDHALGWKKGSRRTQRPTKSTTHSKDKFEFVFQRCHLKS